MKYRVFLLFYLSQPKQGHQCDTLPNTLDSIPLSPATWAGHRALALQELIGRAWTPASHVPTLRAMAPRGPAHQDMQISYQRPDPLTLSKTQTSQKTCWRGWCPAYFSGAVDESPDTTSAKLSSCFLRIMGGSRPASSSLWTPWRNKKNHTMSWQDGCLCP